MASQYRIRLATVADAVTLIRLATEAFTAAGNKIDTSMFPAHLRTETSQQEALDWRVNTLRPTLDHSKFPDRWFIVAVLDAENGEEQVAGWAQWQVPVKSDGELSEPNSKIQTPEQRFEDITKRAGGLPASMDQVAAKAFMEESEKFKKDTLGEEGDKNMWTLQTLAVSPSHQRHGVGSMLVKWGLDRARDSQLDAYLLGTGVGRKLYLSLGFEDLAPCKSILEEPHYSMIKRHI